MAVVSGGESAQAMGNINRLVDGGVEVQVSVMQGYAQGRGVGVKGARSAVDCFNGQIWVDQGARQTRWDRAYHRCEVG